MTKVLKRQGASNDPTDLGTVTVIETDDAQATVIRWRFLVDAKRRENYRRTKDERAQKYGGGAEMDDYGGICAGETLRLLDAQKIVHGRQAVNHPDVIPQYVADALQDAGATEIRA